MRSYLFDVLEDCGCNRILRRTKITDPVHGNAIDKLALGETIARIAKLAIERQHLGAYSHPPLLRAQRADKFLKAADRRVKLPDNVQNAHA
jgi:hypothetical protein